MRTLSFSFFVLIYALLFSQTNDFEYSYDANGNRVLRELIVYKSPEAGVSEQPTDTATTFITDMQVTVFPNPTMGELCIGISNLEAEAKGSVVLYDLSGKPIMRLETIQQQMKLDLGTQPAGSYVLQLIIDDQKKEWRVVKNRPLGFVGITLG